MSGRQAEFKGGVRAGRGDVVRGVNAVSVAGVAQRTAWDGAEEKDRGGGARNTWSEGETAGGEAERPVRCHAHGSPAAG